MAEEAVVPIQDLIAYSAALAEKRAEGEGIESAINDRELTSCLLAQAEVARAAMQDAGDSKCSRCPGYVEVEVRDLVLFVPYNLVQAFPFARTLDELASISHSVRLTQGGSLCISGSATYLGAGLAIGDLDFCEYIERLHDDIIVTAKKIVDFERSEPYCVRIKWNEYDFSAPWTIEAKVFDEAQNCVANGGFDRDHAWKFDFVGRLERYGPIVITNIGLPVDYANIEYWAKGKSWAYQEVPVLRAWERQPRSLVLREHLGEYALWLRQQIDCHLPDTPLKATKRALSLASLFGLGTAVDRLVDLLCGSDVRKLVHADRIAEVKQKLESCDDDNACALKQDLQQNDEGNVDAARSGVFRRVRQEVEFVLEEIDALLDVGRRAVKEQLNERSS